MEILHSELDGIAVYAEALDAIITARAPEKMKRPSDVVLRTQRSNGVAFWGDEDNLFPEHVIDDIENNDVVDTVLNWKSRELMGGGVAYGNLVMAGDGYEVLEPMRIPEIEDWLETTRYSLTAMEQALDFYTLYNTNAHFVQGPSGRINGLFTIDQSQVRLKENNGRGEITELYAAHDWSRVSSPKGDTMVRVFPALDPYFDIPGQIASLSTSANEFVLPIRYQVRRRKYYALAPWNGLRTTQWLPYASGLAKVKANILKYGMLAPIHIEVADAYWPRRFGAEWEKADDDGKRKLMKDEIERWNKTLAGEKNAGKSIVTRLAELKHTNELVSLVKFNQMKPSIPDGMFTEDSAEADHHIIRALGVDPGLVGITPSKNRQSGSGSDKRVARTNYLLGERAHGDLLLTPMRVVSAVNGWNKRYNQGRPLAWMFTNLYAATLDRTQQVDSKPNAGNDAAQ